MVNLSVGPKASEGSKTSPVGAGCRRSGVITSQLRPLRCIYFLHDRASYAQLPLRRFLQINYLTMSHPNREAFKPPHSVRLNTSAYYVSIKTQLVMSSSLQALEDRRFLASHSNTAARKCHQDTESSSLVVGKSYTH